MPQAAAFAIAAVIDAAGTALATAGVATGIGALTAAGAGLAGVAAFAVGNAAIFGTLAIGLGSLAVQSISSALFHPPTIASSGSPVQFSADPLAGAPYVIGRMGVGGDMIFADVSGATNKYLTYGVALTAAGPIDAIESFAANQTAVSFTVDGGEGASGYYLNRMWQKQQLGAASAPQLHYVATGSKDTPANHSGLPATWGSDQKLTGFAACIWTLEFDQKVYSTGVPKPLWVVRGVHAYDPRLDSTYPGGSGPQRIGDETTWGYSANPGLHALTWLIGRRANGVRTLGCGLPITGIDIAAHVELANVCDANGWTCAGLIRSTDAKWDVYRAILVAGSAEPIRLGALVSCRIDTPRVSLTTITGLDVSGEASIAATTSRRTRINTVWPRYREETQDWEIVPTSTPVSIPDYVAADGGQRSKEIEFTLVTQAGQAQQLATYQIENAREFGPITLPCKPYMMGYRPGDCVTVDEPEYGLSGQTVIILSRSIDAATLETTLTCRSETTAKHAYALGQTATAPATPGLTYIDPSIVPAPSPAVWTATGATFTANGVSLPGIVLANSLALDETDNANADAVRFEYRPLRRVGDQAAWAGGVYGASGGSSAAYVASGMAHGSSGWGVHFALAAGGVGVGEITPIGLTPGTTLEVTALAWTDTGTAPLFADLFPDDLPESPPITVTTTPAPLTWSTVVPDNPEVASCALRLVSISPPGACNLYIADIQWRATTTTDWIGAGLDAHTVRRKEITGLTPGSDYDVAVSYRVRGVLGDRLVIPAVTAGDFSQARGAHAWTTRSVAYPVASTATTITIAACTYVLDDGRTVSLPATSFTGLPNSTLYSVFWDLGVGAAYTLATSPSLTSMANPSLLLIDTIQTLTSGGGTPAPPYTPPPGYGGGPGNPTP